MNMKRQRMSIQEVEATGARASDVDVIAFGRFNDFRDKVGVPISFVKNGITTGEHSAKEHPDGRAFDFFFLNPEAVDIGEVIGFAVMCGFYGVGVYCNASGYFSFHVDTRPKSRFSVWYGAKAGDDTRWTYFERLSSFLAAIKGVL